MPLIQASDTGLSPSPQRVLGGFSWGLGNGTFNGTFNGTLQLHLATAPCNCTHQFIGLLVITPKRILFTPVRWLINLLGWFSPFGEVKKFMPSG